MGVFIEGAYLTTFSEEDELSETEFIKRAGGLEKLKPFKQYAYVTLVLDNPKKPLLIGHTNGRTISLVLQEHGHKKWQTMEWDEKS